MTGESCSSGGRSWWAHFAFTRINANYPPKKIEDLWMFGGS